MSDLPSRDVVESSVRRNFNASLLDQLVGLETDKALLQEEVKQLQAQNAQLTRLVQALQAELQKRRPPAELAPEVVATKKHQKQMLKGAPEAPAAE